MSEILASVFLEKMFNPRKRFTSTSKNAIFFLTTAEAISTIRSNRSLKRPRYSDIEGEFYG